MKNNYKFKILIIIGQMILISTAALGQSSHYEELYKIKGLSPGSQIPSIAQEVAPSRNGENKENDLLESFEGWTQLYLGIGNSPIMKDPYKMNEEFPELFADSVDAERPQLGDVYGQTTSDHGITFGNDIGVDDEILKTSMAIYQPIRRMQKDFLQDKYARDTYLENALTIRGVAIMTMGFLDKTVGAGLTAIQQQADQETIQNLLKQISWTTSKIANSDRAQVYRDVDEKVEACLEIAQESTVSASVEGKTRKIAKFQCDQKKCGPPPEGSDYIEKGNGTYAYCVCCSETDEKLNKLTEDGNEEKWDLASRLFYGTKKPDKEKDKIENAIKWFVKTYGNITLEPISGGGGAGGGGSGGSKGNFRYVYSAPKYSVKRFVAAFEDGCKECPGDGQCPLDTQPGRRCTDIQQDFNMKKGICPSLVFVLSRWDQITQGNAVKEDVRAWVEASMGLPLSAKNIESILSLNGSKIKSLKSTSGASRSEEPTGRMRRFIRNFCMTSAVTAVTRYHALFSAIISDYLRLNNQLSSTDKEKIKDLVARFSNQLSLAEIDSSSRYTVEALLTGANVSEDRRLAGEMAAISTASQSTQARAAEAAGLSLFGVPGNTVFNSGAGGITRQADPITQTIDTLK